MDGHEETMTANLIAEYLFSHVDDDGNHQVIYSKIERWKYKLDLTKRYEGKLCTQNS